MSAIRDRIKSLRRVRAGDLIPHPKNWRRHPEAQQVAMRAALGEIGYADALLVRETTKGLQIIDGHLRAELDPDQKVPVLVLDVTAAEAKKLLVTFDPITALAETHEENLRALIEEIDFTLPELDDLVAGLLDDEEKETVEVPAPDPPADPVTRTGDLWLLGEHRVLCGDCLSVGPDGGRQWPVPVMVWSDPPYGLGGYAGRSGAFSPVSGDDAHEAQIWRFFAAGNAAEVYICCEVKSLRHLLAVRGEPRSLIVWAKPHFGMGKGYRRQHEFIAYWGGYAGTTESDLWQCGRDGEYQHPTQKPVALPARAMGNSSKQGDVIFDPFLGSGTTLIAAEQLGRKCYGIEIEPRYVDVTVQRWQGFTEKQAMLEVTGQTFAEVAVERGKA